MATKKTSRRAKKLVEQGVIHIQATFNNTIVTISDTDGNVIAFSSGGMKGFKGTRKGTPFSAQVAAEDAARKAVGFGMKSATVLVKGPGPGREPAIRSIQSVGIRITMIRDVTPLPHNGCRPPGRRRV